MSFISQLSQVTYNSSSSESLPAGFWILFGLFYLFLFICCVISLIGMWLFFKKAGRPGWESIVPVYNMMVMAELAGKPQWWGLGYFISPLNMVVAILFGIEIARRFGRSTTFGAVALGIFPMVGYFMIGLGKDTYIADRPAA